jgi:hypothetical protein
MNQVNQMNQGEPDEPSESYDLRGSFIANVFETKME